MDSSLLSAASVAPPPLPPDKIHNTISVVLRMMQNLGEVFNWDSLVAVPKSSDAPANPADPSAPSNSNAVVGRLDDFRRRFALTVVLTECVERFVFGKLTNPVFEYLLRRSPSESFLRGRKKKKNGRWLGLAPTRKLLNTLLFGRSSSVGGNSVDGRQQGKEQSGSSSCSPRAVGSSSQSENKEVGVEEVQDVVVNRVSNCDDGTQSELNAAIARLKGRVVLQSVGDSQAEEENNRFSRAVMFVRKRLKKLSQIMV